MNQERYRIERLGPPPDELAGTIAQSGDEWLMVRNHDDEPMCVYATKAEADRALAEANAEAQRPAVAGTLPPLVGLSDGGEA